MYPIQIALAAVALASGCLAVLILLVQIFRGEDVLDKKIPYLIALLVVSGLSAIGIQYLL